MAVWEKKMQKIPTPENAPRLFDLVKVEDPKVRMAFYFALRDTLVAKNLEEATRIAFQKEKRWRVVTLQGQIIEVSGTAAPTGAPLDAPCGWYQSPRSSLTSSHPFSCRNHDWWGRKSHEGQNGLLSCDGYLRRTGEDIMEMEFQQFLLRFVLCFKSCWAQGWALVGFVVVTPVNNPLILCRSAKWNPSCRGIPREPCSVRRRNPNLRKP